MLPKGLVIGLYNEFNKIKKYGQTTQRNFTEYKKK